MDEAICPRRFVPREGKQKWVHFKYENYPTGYKFFKCGFVGHEHSSCDSEQMRRRKVSHCLVHGLVLRSATENSSKQCSGGKVSNYVALMGSRNPFALSESSWWKHVKTFNVWVDFQAN